VSKNTVSSSTRGPLSQDFSGKKAAPSVKRDERMKKCLFTVCLMLLLFWPSQAQEVAIQELATPVISAREPIPLPARLFTSSETAYLNNLAARGLSLDRQGLLIESLDGSLVFADHLSDTAFNPASVIKIATSFAALDSFGPDYRFETAFYTDGVLNKKIRTLKGDLILYSTGNPTLTSTELTRLVKQVIKAGVARVSGDLIVSGPFTFGGYYTTEKATRALQRTLRRVGLVVTGTVKNGNVRGTQQASHTSKTLSDILFLQNAHSSNPVAERLGEAVGGPHGVEHFLVEHVGIDPTQISISRTSGLSYNRITPRGTVQLLRALVDWLDAHNMLPEDILPIAGVDPGTLRTRFNTADYRGAVVGKTGTLPATDGGVSTLAGIVYTRDHGPVLFAIFNNKGPVSMYRRLQDTLIKDMMSEFGGSALINASSHRSNN
jgi:D-alanyl-D-alanine carboxypeptidase/D-alanyl-D-alanine-endopeptidase (penicillin-binding protein 4)